MTFVAAAQWRYNEWKWQKIINVSWMEKFRASVVYFCVVLFVSFVFVVLMLATLLIGEVESNAMTNVVPFLFSGHIQSVQPKPRKERNCFSMGITY